MRCLLQTYAFYFSPRTRLAVHIKVEPIATREISMCVITWPMAWHSNILLLDLASKADAKQAHHKLYKSPTAHPDSIQNRSHELIP